MERGVIAAPGIIIPLKNGFKLERALSDEELRYYVMYWDKIIIPANNLVYVQIPGEEDFIQCGAIERPRVNFQGTFSGDQMTNAILSCQSIVAKDLVRDKSTDWVVHQVGEDCTFPTGFNQRRNIIRFDLLNALPMPAPDTNLNEILEFKQRRSAEFKQLHSELDRFYEAVLSSPDIDLASKKETSSLQTAIDNLEKVSREKFGKVHKFDFSAELNLNGKDILTGASTGALLGAFAPGVAIPLTAAAGALISMIKVSAKATSTFQPAAKNTKLAYLYKARKEGII